MNRPVPITRKATFQRAPNPPHFGTDEFDRYEPFYRVWCLTGGLTGETYKIVCEAWDETWGTMPTLVALTQIVRNQQWDRRFAEDMANPALMEEWREEIAAKADLMTLRAMHVTNQIIAGELDPEDAAARAPALKLALMRGALSTRRAENSSRRGRPVLPRGRPRTDLPVSEINRRDDEDFRNWQAEQRTKQDA